MFKLIGLKENVQNIIRLCRSYTQGSTSSDIKKAYKNFLEIIQPTVPHTGQSEEIIFVHRPKDVAVLLKIFEEESVLDDFTEIFDSSIQPEHQISISRVMQALQEIKYLNIEFFHLINLVINAIFFAPSQIAGGGSTSAAIGYIWVNLRDHWQSQDVVEFLIHETTHNLVFLDELCHIHYNDYNELVKPENFSWSAILNKPRPLDKVFHSIVVSTEVLLFREHHLGHPEFPCLHPTSELMLKQTQHSIACLKQRDDLKQLLSKRAQAILDLCEQRLQAITFSQIAVNV